MFYPMLDRSRAMLLPFFLMLVSGCIFAQSKEVPKTLLFDWNGNLISNSEFVDIRMANFHYADATIVKTRDDGTIEFRLQKIPQEGEMAPRVSFRSLSGEKIDLAELRGKVVVLNFWFIGCASCQAHQPKLNDLKAKFANENNVVFLAATADQPSDVKKYLSKQKFDFIQAADADAELRAFRFSGYPRNIVISKTGEIVYWRTTVHAWDKFESVIRRELRQ